jgi:PAS domain S-box-containing protein
MTKKGSDDSQAAGYSSAPCSMHEVDPAYMGLEGAVDIPGLPGENLWISLGEALLTGLPDAIIYSDSNGLIRFWNSGAQRIFGYSQAEALDQSLDIIIPERLRSRHWEGYDGMMKTGKTRHEPDKLLAVPAVNKAGQKLSIQFTVAPVTGRHGSLAGIVAVLRDVTTTFEEIRRLRADRS